MNDLLRQSGNILLVSIKPRFVSKLLDGSKSTELRRIKPRVQNGDVVLIYETSPTMALVGYGVVDSVTSGKPSSLWRKVGGRSGITKSEFDEYYHGAAIGHAINFLSIYRLAQPVSLVSIREKVKGFHPPQSYRYLCATLATSICIAS